jgi:hypothetical protein
MRILVCAVLLAAYSDNGLLIYMFVLFFFLGAGVYDASKSILLTLNFSNTEKRVQLVIIKRSIIVTELVIPDVEGCQLFSR